MHFDELCQNPASRRSFLARMTAAGLGVAALQLLDGQTASAQRRGLTPVAVPPATLPPASYPTDPSVFGPIPGRDINEVVLNFALTLEILEADLYRQALNVASGLPIGNALAADPSVYSLQVPTGGILPKLVPAGFAYIRDFAYVEATHRDFLIMALQQMQAPVVAPNPGGYAFPGGPGGTLASILAAILPLEETGVRAYLGAAPYLTSLPLAVTAVGIYSTECRHSAAVSYILNVDTGPNKMPGDLLAAGVQPSENTFEYFLTPDVVLQRASAFFA